MDHYKDAFIAAADSWVCDSYSIDIRYFAGKVGDQLQLWEALISLNPLPPTQDMNFRIELNQFFAGQYQLSHQPKKKLFEIIERATQGKIKVNGKTFCLSGDRSHDFSSEMVHSDRWFSDLHLQVSNERPSIPSAMDIAEIENGLRKNELPFDGLADIAGWLGLNVPPHTPHRPSINIRVGPPVDLIVPESKLENDQLVLILHAHPRFDVQSANLAVRSIPGKGLASRKQIGTGINWKRARDGRRVGIANISLEHADSVLVMLMIGGSTVRRQWILDPAKARNSRLIALQHFDKELRMVKQAVLEPSGSSASERFEQGVAALLFLLGFTPVHGLEKDSPDIIVATPSGKLAIIECTTKIADFGTKLGKLVDRKVSLSKALQASSHHSRVDAVLVCALPKNQIATHADELRAHQVILFAREDLVTAFEQLRFQNNPDEMLDRAVAELVTASSPTNFLRGR